jgi:hypothetical protein
MSATCAYMNLVLLQRVKVYLLHSVLFVTKSLFLDTSVKSMYSILRLIWYVYYRLTINKVVKLSRLHFFALLN